MSKRLIIILALAFVVGITCAAFAEVQNVKVGGDITVVGAIRNQLDLVGNTGTADAANADAWVTITRVKFDANLTDNVDATIRMINERVWSSGAATSTIGQSGTGVDLDLAYVTLKDFMKDNIKTPVTLVIGRQDIKIGSGLLIGKAGTNQVGALSNLPAGLGDFSTKAAFDAIVGVVDLSPVTVTTGFVKVAEGTITQGRDDNLYVVDAVYPLGKDSKDTVLEGTYVLDAVRKTNIHNIGGRVTSKPMENLGVEAEYVYQTAKQSYLGTWLDLNHKTKNSEAIRLAASYALPDVTWKPTIGADYGRFSNKWNPMHEDLVPADLANALFANTNVACIGASVAAKPKDDLTLKLRYANLALAKALVTGTTIASVVGTNYTMTDKKSLGNEYDLGLAYDYTQDVQFGLNFGLFDPGKAFNAANKKSASQVVGSMKVTF
jgi:hypothetical protein